MRRRMILLAVIGALLALPALASAQQAQAEITGVVRDASGGVLPGVTVEASSPVLTEKVRTVVSDGTGQYRFVGMPPGTYTVTFTLTGFNTFRREGVELTGTFIATINADLRVGALQETVTVTGESPVVDVQSARRQSVISGDVLQAIPTSRSYNNVLQLVPGVDPGTAQIQLAPTMLLFTAHGGNSRDGRLTVDGINTGASRGGSGVSGYVPDMQNTQEVAFSISGNLGEAETGGPQMSVMPKAGGNRFSGSFFYTRIGQGMQDSNFTDRLRAAGLTAPPKILHLFDGQGSVGGPIKRDRIWFFYNTRVVGRGDAQPGIFANKNAGDPTKWTYEPDLTQQGRIDTARYVNALRLTWQMTARNKLSVFYDNQPQCTGAGWVDAGGCRTTIPGTDGYIAGGSQVNGFFGPGPNAPETGDYQQNPQRVQQAKWQSPATNKLLLEAGFGIYASRWGYDERPGNPTRDLVRVQEQGTIPGTGLSNLKYRSSNWPHGFIGAHTWNASASYVTGAHNVKIGYQGAYHRDVDNLFGIINNTQRLQYRFLNGVPNLITQDAGPWTRRVQTEYAAFFVQDSWTYSRMTLQGALRYDRSWSGYPPQQVGPDRFVPVAITFDETKGVLGYNDISPRVGLAYDLFGDGKTSLKANFGKYLAPATNQAPYITMNPVERLSTQTTRSWNDRGGLGINGDYIPQCDLMNPAGNGECGPWLDQNFLRNRPTTTLSPQLLEGWGVRANDWQFGVSIQREVAPRVSVEVGYYRRWWNNFIDSDPITDNVLTQPGDYQSYSVTAPRDSRLPGGGGFTVGPLYDINPATGLAGRFDNILGVSEVFGAAYTRNSDFIDINVSARLRNGITLQGGTSTGRVTTDTCEARAKIPESALPNPYCSTQQPMLTTVKAIGTYIIPKAEVQVSGTFSSLPGVSLAANVVVPTAVIAQSLGRPLSSNQPSVTVNMIRPQTVFGDRANDLDLRIAKIVRVAGTRTNLALDVVNSLNSDAVLGYNPTLGTISTAGVFTANATWPTPTAVLQARLVRVSIQFDW